MERVSRGCAKKHHVKHHDEKYFKMVWDGDLSQSKTKSKYTVSAKQMRNTGHSQIAAKQGQAVVSFNTNRLDS